MRYPAECEVLEGVDASVRLETLGLTQPLLVRAVLAAAMERRNTSLLEPSNAPGFKAWARGFGVLAEELIPMDWRKVETNGLPRVVHPTSGVAIALVNGDDATGVYGRDPKSKTRRGPQSILLVHSNERQLQLFELSRFHQTPAAEEQVTWWLLMYFGADRLRAELSLPIGIGEDSKLSLWKTRIILDVPADGFEREAGSYDDDALQIEEHLEPPGGPLAERVPCLCDPLAVHRSAVGIVTGSRPTMRELLVALGILGPTTMDAFNPHRLQLARGRRGKFQKQLAADCGVTPQTYSSWEGGGSVPSQENLAALSRELIVPTSFFFSPVTLEVPDGAASFRARSKLTSRERHAALAAGAMALELANWIEARFDLPAVNIPDLHGQTPAVAAQVVRSEWGLGDKPIPNMIHLLESKGVLVFSLAQDCRDLDAFSFRIGSRPIVLLNTMKSPDRSRIDAAHELAHLLLHVEETGKQEEEQADAFAGAFLMPKVDVFRHVPRSARLADLIEAKQRWGVSLAALVYRLHAVGVISEWQYRTLFVELSKRGYRTNEPKPIERETSILLNKVFACLRERGVTLRGFASELRWNPADLNELLFGLGGSWLAVSGGAEPSPTASRPALKIVSTDSP